MSTDEMYAILDQLFKVEPGLKDTAYSEQYRRCYATYQAMDKAPEDWYLLELMDPTTLEHKWYWRKKL